MPAARPLFIHIGLQKTGTSYLQSIFWQSQEALRSQGLDMVPGSKRETFHLMLRVRDRYNPDLDPPVVAQALDRLPDQLTAAPGDRALISEESLAAADERQVKRLLDACAGREVHVIVTVRDFGRQIPSAWQEELRAGSAMTFAAYLRRLRRTESSPKLPLWRNKEVSAVLDRWEKFVPSGRIHVVTVPPPGSGPELLLQRFCSVLDISVGSLDREVARSNASLGRVQAEVLRRVNAGLAPEFRRRQLYGDVGKRYFANQVLGRGDRILVPDDYEQWCREVSQRHIDRIRDGGFDVVGDLADLQPAPSVFARAGDPAPDEVAEVAVAALVTVLTDTMRSRREQVRDHGRFSWLRRSAVGRRISIARDRAWSRIGRH